MSRKKKGALGIATGNWKIGIEGNARIPQIRRQAPGFDKKRSGRIDPRPEHKAAWGKGGSKSLGTKDKKESAHRNHCAQKRVLHMSASEGALLPG